MTLKLIDFSILITSFNNHLVGSSKKYLFQVLAIVEKLVKSIGLVWKKHGQRVQLRRLTDQQLKDMGISRNEAEKEASKIF